MEAVTPDHQATIVLALLDTIRQGEWGTWVENALALQQMSERNLVNASFPVVTVSRAAGIRISMDGRGQVFDNIFMERL